MEKRQKMHTPKRVFKALSHDKVRKTDAFYPLLTRSAWHRLSYA